MIQKTKKNITCFLLIIFILYSFLVSCFVSASTFLESDFANSSSYTDTVTSQYLEDFYNNSSVVNMGFTPENSVFLYDGSQYNYVCCFKIDSDCVVSQALKNGVTYDVIYCKGSNVIYTSYCPPSSFNSYNFRSYVNATFLYPCICKINANTYFSTTVSPNSTGVLNDNVPSNLSYNMIFNNGSFVKIVDLDLEEVPLPFYSLDVDDFYTWLVDNDKISLDISSGGASVGGKIPGYIGVSKLKSFLEFYKQVGSSNTSFINKIGLWFSNMNIVAQSKDNIQILKSITDNLYREYLESISGTHAYWPSATKIQERQNIDTITDDNNTLLITDDSNDTVDISILRDILRGVIAVSNNLNKGVSDIVTQLRLLDFTVNVSNDGGTGLSSSDIWGSGSITESENYLALTAAFMDKGVDVSAAENMQINYLDNAAQADSFTVSVVMPDQFVNGQFTEKTVTHTIDNTSKMYNTLILFRKLIAFVVVAYFAIRIRFELPHLIRGE